jgi:outer membrane protein assembly factor BamB
VWQRVFPAPVLSVAPDDAGSFFLAFWGYEGLDIGDGVLVSGNSTWNVAKIGPDGHAIWGVGVGPVGTAGGSFRHIASDGVNAYLAADIQDDQGAKDVIAKIGPNGDLLWEVDSPGSLGYLDSVFVAADGAGMVYAASSPTWGGAFGSSLPAGMGSALVALDPSGKQES